MDPSPIEEYSGTAMPIRMLALLAVAVMAGGSALLGFGSANVRMIFEKVATHLVMPFGICWLLLSGAVFAIGWSRRSLVSSGLVKPQTLRFTFRSLFLTWVLLYATGNGMIAKWAMRSLDRDFCQVDLDTIETLDALIVLGGCTTTRPNGDQQLNDGGDRVMTAARLYHAEKARQIICTGSLIPGLDRIGKEQSELAMDLLAEIGVPREAMQKIGGRNTTEEMAALGKMFAPQQRVGLCTSAWHMKRAMRLAANQGFHPVPIPCDFRTPPNMRPTIVDFVPTADASDAISLAAKEWLALLVGR